MIFRLFWWSGHYLKRKKKTTKKQKKKNNEVGRVGYVNGGAFRVTPAVTKVDSLLRSTSSEIYVIYEKK